MKKKLLALFTVCSMITTAVAGLVQTAYAAGPGGQNVRIVVSDGDSDTEKVLTFYYEGVSGLYGVTGYLEVSEGATITFIESTMGKYKFDGVEEDYAALVFANDSAATSSDDCSFGTATVTVPGDVDIIATFEVTEFVSEDQTDFAEDIGTVSVTIPKKSSEPETPATVETSVEESKAYVDKNDETKCAVVGKINLTVDGSINLADATYGGNKAQAITDMNDQALADTVITDADIILFVVINGTTDVAELDNVVFE